MIDVTKIKLIIWDLDETLWEGTLSDNDTLRLREDFVALIHATLDRGMVHAICSKNDMDAVREQLTAWGLGALFVFPSVDWPPKGQRVENLLREMGLRAENALFVDDNRVNLKEAVYYCPALQVCTPAELVAAATSIAAVGTVDTARPRLAQYRILEQKAQKKQESGSNEEFLMSCHIRVETHTDCAAHIDRIHDLIMRSNQLNYTKFRQDKAELLAQLALPTTTAAYVTVADDFGDYGIVGFYMLVDGVVQHFLFSCRTLGMLVEQYIYRQIGCPPLTVVGEVVTPLNDTDTPPWINRDTAVSSLQKQRALGQTILFKGPCDIKQIFSFIDESNNIHSEFAYVNPQGVFVEGHNHTAQLATTLTATAEDKARLLADAPWLADAMPDTAWGDHDTVVFSLLTDGNVGAYRHKTTGHCVALCEGYYDLTDPANHPAYVNKTIFTSQMDFTAAQLADFAEHFTYLPNADGAVTMANLDVLYSAKKAGAQLILLLGSERPFEGKTKPSYAHREEFHRVLNAQVRTWAADKADVQRDYTDTINHFPKRVYYAMAQDIIGMLNGDQSALKMRSKAYLWWVTIHKRVRTAVKTLLGMR